MAKRNKTAPVAPADVVEASAPDTSQDEVRFDSSAPTFESNEVSDEESASVSANSNGAPTAEDDADAQANDRAVVGGNSAAIMKAERAKVYAAVRKKGEDEGNGAKAQVAMAEVVITGAMNGYIVSADAKGLYDKFRTATLKAQGNFAPTPQSKESENSQVSKVNAFIKLGMVSNRLLPSDGDITDALDLWRRVVDMHIQYANSQEKSSLKYPGTYAALLSVVTAQNSREGGYWFTNDDIRGLLLKEGAGKSETTAVDLVTQALDKLEKARNGRKATDNKPSREPLEHQNLDHAIAHILHLLGDISPSFVEARNAKLVAEQQKLAA